MNVFFCLKRRSHGIYLKNECLIYCIKCKEYEGEAICMDLFDFQTEASSSDESSSITTRVVIGIHDSTLWDTIKKNVQETHNSPGSDKHTTAINSNYNHNLLVQTVQTQAVISRLAYVSNSLSGDYYCHNPDESVKLCCKVLVFDFNHNIFNG